MAKKREDLHVVVLQDSRRFTSSIRLQTTHQFNAVVAEDGQALRNIAQELITKSLCTND